MPLLVVFDSAEGRKGLRLIESSECELKHLNALASWSNLLGLA